MADKMPASAIGTTISERIYYYLQELIIKNKIAPNQRINEKEIAARFDSSTTPVREAMLKLAAEGFVQINPYRHSVVKEISSKEMEEMYEVMTILDYHAMKLVLKGIGDEEVQRITDLTLKLEQHCSLEHLEKYLEINALIHTTIWESIKNRYLYTTLHRVYNQIQRYSYVRYSLFKKHGALKKSLKKHRRLLDVINSRNSSTLLNLVRDHWRV